MTQGQPGQSRDPVVVDKFIEIEIHSPDMPDLDLVDTPGIRAAANNNNQSLIESILARYNKECQPIYLFACPFLTDPSTMASIASLQRLGLQKRSVAVVTKADMLNESDFSDYISRLAHELDLGPDQGMLKNSIFTVSKGSKDAPNMLHHERLKVMAAREMEWFSNNGHQDELGSKVGVSALITKLSELIRSDLKDSWLPKAVVSIQEGIWQQYDKFVSLGMPPTHGEATNDSATIKYLRAPTIVRVNQLIDQSPSLLSLFASGPLAKLQTRIISHSSSTRLAIPAETLGAWISNLKTEFTQWIDEALDAAPAFFADELDCRLASDESALKLGRF